MKYSTPVSLILFSVLSFFITSTTYAVGEGNRIDMSVSPIRDEFNVERGTPTVRTLQYSNNSDGPYNIYVTIEDCAPSGNYGTPICRAATGSGIQSEFSSTWIDVSESSFVVPAHTTKTISYTVNSPANAAPGGHYGAIFFNNPDTPSFGSNTVGMIRRIGMLYMMSIPGNIIVDPSLGSILVDGPGGGSVGSLDWTFNSAPELIDKIRKNWNSSPMWDEVLNDINPLWDKPMLENDSFSLTLKVPVKNDGNIHIKPTGKVYIFDENGTQLENVGKESIVDENGVYLGEKITNYLPINDERGSVLPNTERVFQIDWLGFGYEERDPTTGKFGIQFETPGRYYSRLTEEGTQYIYPWERLSIRKVTRHLTGKVEFTYNDVTTGEDVTKTMEIPLTITYSYIVRTLNYGMLFLVAFIIFFAWIFIRKRDKRIEVLEEANDELEDEITVLERARKQIIPAKKNTKTPAPQTKKVATEKKEITTKSPTKKLITRKPQAKKSGTKSTDSEK